VPVKSAILTVGSEITTGRIADTNAQWVAGRLLELGIPVRLMVSVDDVEADIVEGLRVAMSWGELVWITGGMGPTEDDLTVGTVARALGLPLVEDPGTAGRVREWYSRRNTPPPEGSLRQAMVPAGARVYDNPVGSAPGLMVEAKGSVLVMLPGVPAEMKALADGFMLPTLRDRGVPTETRIFRMAGVPESVVDARVRDLWRGLKAGETMALQIENGEVFLRAAVSSPEPGQAADRMARLEGEIRERLGHDFYGVGEAGLEEAVVGRLREMKATVATAESVTGGMIASRLASVPGASGAFLGGIVAYGEGAKSRLLGVPAGVLGEKGVVSAETALAMAAAVRKSSGADWAVATTGYAGPAGGTERDPVGTVYIAVEGPGGSSVEKRWFRGARNTVRTYSATLALDMLRRALGG
jgi:nicotinamide-nucleotide amidase